MLSRRLFSTSIKRNAQFTTLKNGLVVATESNPLAKNSSIGVYLGAGSRSENPYNSGVSSLTSSVLIHDSKKSAYENGVLLSTSQGKEITGLNTQFTNGSNAKKAFEILSSALSKNESALSNSSLITEQAKIAGEFSELIEQIPEKTVLEHLHSTAFQGTSLALPTYGKSDTVSTLEPMDLSTFFNKHYVASNVAIVGTGDVKHEELVELASKLSVPSGLKPVSKPSSFLGSDVRFRDDTLPKAYVAIAVQGETIDSPSYWTAKVASEVSGSYERTAPFSKFLGSKLSAIVEQFHLANKYYHFSNSYSDNGLWGFYTESDNIGNFDDMVHFTLKEWNRLSASVSETEVERAKATLKLKVLSILENSVEHADALATDALLLGYKASPEEIINKINKVNVSSVKNWAQATLYDKDIAISGTGQIEALFDYNRVRNDMSMMRW